MKQVFVDPERCTGCRTCEINCAVAHSSSKTLLGAMAEQPMPKKRLYVEQGSGVKLPVMCRHCEEAPCVSACISGCLYRDERGFVLRHKERCIGCWSCIMACPFGVVSQDSEKHLAVKCDRCNKQEVPACVASCPTKALMLIEADDFADIRRMRVAAAETGQQK